MTQSISTHGLYSQIKPNLRYSQHMFTKLIKLSRSTVHAHEMKQTLTIHSMCSQTLSTEFKSHILCKRRWSATYKFAVSLMMPGCIKGPWYLGISFLDRL